MVDTNKQHALDRGVTNVIDDYGDDPSKSDREMAKVLRWMLSKKKDHGLQKGL
jgi:hypothetical protein